MQNSSKNKEFTMRTRSRNDDLIDHGADRFAEVNVGLMARLRIAVGTNKCQKFTPAVNDFEQTRVIAYDQRRRKRYVFDKSASLAQVLNRVLPILFRLHWEELPDSSDIVFRRR